MIHDTFKHGIFNLINYLWAKRVTHKTKQNKKYIMLSKTFRTIQRIICLWGCKSPVRPGSYGGTRAGTRIQPCECQAGFSLCTFLQRDVRHPAEGCMEEDWNEILSNCITLNYPCLKRAYARVASDILAWGWMDLSENNSWGCICLYFLIGIVKPYILFLLLWCLPCFPFLHL